MSDDHAQVWQWCSAAATSARKMPNSPVVAAIEADDGKDYQGKDDKGAQCAQLHPAHSKLRPDT